jgi:hypothetical protein
MVFTFIKCLLYKKLSKIKKFSSQKWQVGQTKIIINEVKTW